MNIKFIDGPMHGAEREFGTVLKFIEVPVSDPKEVWRQDPEVTFPMVGERRSFLYQVLPVLAELSFQWAVPADWTVEHARSQRLIDDSSLALMTLSDLKNLQAAELVRFTENAGKTLIRETVVITVADQPAYRSTLIRVEGYIR